MGHKHDKLDDVAVFGHAFTVPAIGAIDDELAAGIVPDWKDAMTWDIVRAEGGMMALSSTPSDLADDVLSAPGIYAAVLTDDETAWMMLRLRACFYVFDGEDTDGTWFYRCLAHDDTTPSDFAHCGNAPEGPAYVLNSGEAAAKHTDELIATATAAREAYFAAMIELETCAKPRVTFVDDIDGSKIPVCPKCGGEDHDALVVEDDAVRDVHPERVTSDSEIRVSYSSADGSAEWSSLTWLMTCCDLPVDLPVGMTEIPV